MFIPAPIFKDFFLKGPDEEEGGDFPVPAGPRGGGGAARPFLPAIERGRCNRPKPAVFFVTALTRRRGMPPLANKTTTTPKA